MQRPFSHLLIVLLATCLTLPSAALAKKVKAGGPLVIVESHGGICPHAGECRDKAVISQDGQCSGSLCPQAPISAEDLGRLKKMIESTDYDHIRESKFTATCPTAFDGKEIAYRFHTSHGDEQLDSCKYDIVLYREPFHTLWKILDKKS